MRNETCLIRRVRTLVAAGALGAAAASVSLVAADKQPFRVEGTFVEGCSCHAPCPCELIGVPKGCEGVGAISFSGGEFNGVDLAGARIAYALVPGEWVRLYADAPKPEQRAAALAFAKAYYGTWGKLEAARPASISIEGKDGHFTVKVDNGRILQLKTEPVLGGDQKTPIAISNTKSVLNPTVLQGRTVSGSFKEGDHSFQLKDSNSYFAPVKTQGEL